MPGHPNTLPCDSLTHLRLQARESSLDASKRGQISVVSHVIGLAPQHPEPIIS